MLVFIFIKLVDISFLFISVLDEFDKIVFSRSRKLLFTDIKFIFLKCLIHTKLDLKELYNLHNTDLVILSKILRTNLILIVE